MLIPDDQIAEHLSQDLERPGLGEPLPRDLLGLFEIPGLSIYTCELTVHTWDLAKALGVEPQWYEPDVAACVQVMQMGMPSEPRGGDIPFGPVVQVPADAASIDKLVAWVSRQP